MIKSKFTLQTLLIPVMIIVIPIISAYLFSNILPIKLETVQWSYAIIILMFLYSWCLLVFGTLRKSIINIKIYSNKISVKNFLGYEREFDFRDFDGFQISFEKTKSGTYEALFLVKHEKKLIHISEFYHQNYFELKAAIETRTENLGKVHLNFFARIKDLLSNH